MNPIQRAIDLAGGLTALADKLGENPQTVSNWRARGVPAERCAQVEQAVNGVISRCDLYSGDPSKIWPELCSVPKA